MSPRVVVTGCTGLVGHGICLTLLEHGYDVVGTSRHALRSRHPRFQPVRLDLRDRASIEAFEPALDDVDVLVHNAAKRPAAGEDDDTSWAEYYAVNVAATRQLLVSAARRGVHRVLFISGVGILHESGLPLDERTPFLPRTNYGASKVAAEMICLQFDAQDRVPVCVLRFPAPYGYAGSADAVIPRFIRSACAGEPLTLWGSGSRQQTFTFVADIGQACLRAIERRTRGTFHVAGPEAVSMTELAEAVLRAFPGTGSRIQYDGRPDPQENRRVAVSFEKARRELGYEPRFSLAYGLEAIAQAGKSAVIFERDA